MSTQKNLTDKRWLTSAEAAVYINRHPVTVRKMFLAGMIPATKLAGRILVDREKLDLMLSRMIEARTSKSRGGGGR